MLLISVLVREAAPEFSHPENTFDYPSNIPTNLTDKYGYKNHVDGNLTSVLGLPYNKSGTLLFTIDLTRAGADAHILIENLSKYSIKSMTSGVARIPALCHTRISLVKYEFAI